ncbi:MAG: hypothetical protein KDJ88_02955 [Bauldia sp.]|nr:hypothetical protein [Bauldia sp.]
MMGHRQIFLATLAVFAAIGAAGPAFADSRIFTARTDQDGVTIDKASRNGQVLAIVGHGDGTTLFRIDSPSTPVGCANRIEFVASTGEHVDLVSDMCALNWDVTVKVKAPDVAAAPAVPAEPTQPATPATPAEPEAPAARVIPEVPAIPAVPAVPGSDTEVAAPAAGEPGADTDKAFTQVVSVSTDHPTATILAVRLDGKPVNIIGRKDGAVQFEVEEGEEGIVCDRDVELTLSNGSLVSQKSNICLNDWSVMVSVETEGEDIPATTPAPPVATAPEPPAAEAPGEKMIWIFSTFEKGASLGHGIPETDASNFGAACVPKSGKVLVTLLDTSVPGLSPNSAIPISFSSPGFNRTYTGLGSPVDNVVGTSLPQVEIPLTDELWSAIVREKSLRVTAGPSSFQLSLDGSAGPAREFLAACAGTPIAKPAPAEPAPSGGGIVARYSCASGTKITVRFNGANQTAILTETGAPPVTLHWDPGANFPRYVAGPARLVLRDDSEVRWSRFGGPAVGCRQR